MTQPSEEDKAAFVEKLAPFGELARTTWNADGTPWAALDLGTRYRWSRIADAVLTAYDPEWTSRKAGL